MVKQSGFLMMVIAVLLVVIAGLATAFVSMIISGTNSSISTISANNAYDLAITGIENGSYQLSLGMCDNAWSTTILIPGQGEYQYNCSQDQASTTITSSLSISSSSIPLASIANFETFGAISIDSEIIYYDGINGNTLLNARRGQNGTIAASHFAGAVVNQSQYIINSQGGAPSLYTPNGQVMLTQAVLLAKGSYYAVGTQGSRGVILNYNGTSWTTSLTANGVTLRGIDISTNYGLAVGSTATNTGYMFQFNGSSWSLLGTESGSNFTAVSCDVPSNPTQCWIVGQEKSPQWPLMYNTGTGTSYHTNSAGSVPVSSVSCMNDICMATLPNDLYVFPVNSTTPFANRTNIGGTINGIDCTQANSCVLVRSIGAVHYFNGFSWSNAFNITGQSLNEVHCPSTSNCMVVGNNGVIFNCSLPITSNASCVAQASPGTMNLLGIHCNASNDCLAVGAGALAYRYTGGTWTAIPLPTSYTLNSVSGTGSGTGSGVTPTVLHNQ
ncbi:hypothetical protein [Legionella sainthelensi]|uniref:Uncharacterized protein n=1 Tax=Legionella sainthelensi TaxID=28087 RepID=A0A2H5FK92_9GAMM|nr:hypothetical protein [Legionella sainthelensi]AUH71953.1 hypothetical protein CAB17_07645 [Legionella sainthelensi]